MLRAIATTLGLRKKTFTEKVADNKKQIVLLTSIAAGIAYTVARRLRS